MLLKEKLRRFLLTVRTKLSLLPWGETFNESFHFFLPVAPEFSCIICCTGSVLSLTILVGGRTRMDNSFNFFGLARSAHEPGTYTGVTTNTYAVVLSLFVAAQNLICGSVGYLIGDLIVIHELRRIHD